LAKGGEKTKTYQTTSYKQLLTPVQQQMTVNQIADAAWNEWQTHVNQYSQPATNAIVPYQPTLYPGATVAPSVYSYGYGATVTPQTYAYGATVTALPYYW